MGMSPLKGYKERAMRIKLLSKDSHITFVLILKILIDKRG
jgi:hypothetical protein